MASICPHCSHPEAVAVLENADGIYVFPCLFCHHVPRNGVDEHTQPAAAPCAVPRCGGSVVDHYVYGSDHVAPVAITRYPCTWCGSARTREPDHARSARGRALADPRL
ncbi:hypothetical protein AB0I49_12570 [Streptomyces sp. NPDC050617]|uniref:hypothetical protein n=1 Tax=Streptomyces sp. NPDC050617 TaxID=3154628 RepID=UPI00342EA622